ncbi:MAG: type II toxin-antitoxin system VapC family toxin [Candidatus Brockarchaeota archaeon]|nr:type II toxin-antitoxin system VapC family toxin [Candidatus Brockarchaeota archaeon]
MMIETDIIYAYVKTEDWLKNIAEKLIRRISKGEFGTVYASREVFHEMYYVSQQEGVSIDEYISRVAALTAIENIVFLETTSEIDLLALILMKQYRFKSIFDAYYAATALNQVPDHSIVSTDTVFDNVAGIKRIDPREI